VLDVNKEEIYTIIALILSIIAILQTRKQIIQSKKENLFEKRIEAFFMCQKLVYFYKQKKSLFQKDMLSYNDIEKIYKYTKEYLNLKEENEIERIKKILETITFLYEKNYISYIQNFCYVLIFLIQQLFYAHKFLEKINKIKGIKMNELQDLKEYFLNNTFLPSWIKGQESLKRDYQYIEKKKIIKKLKHQIK